MPPLTEGGHGKVSKADSKRGIQRERDLVNLLRDEDWLAMRSPASLGPVDVIAMKAGHRTRLIEVKSTSRSAFAGFPPADRAGLSFMGKLADADCYLVYWPKRSKPVWIPESDWP